MTIARREIEWLFVFVYFFVNSLFLPHGLLYTSLLFPFFWWYLHSNGSKRTGLLFGLFLLPYFAIHTNQAIDYGDYLQSSILFFSVYLFTLATYKFIQKSNNLEWLYRKVVESNLLLLGFGIIILTIPPLWSLTWSTEPISPGVPIFPRFRGFTYEPSYYSLLFAPFVIYYYLKCFFQGAQHWWKTLLAVTIPLVLSLSFGVIALVFCSIVLISFMYSRAFWKSSRFRNLVKLSGVLLLLALFLGIVVFPDNPVSLRIANIFSGQDSSFQGRTSDSFELAYLIAKEKNMWFGVGLGQVKIVGHEIIVNYYNYTDADNWTVRLPNAVADTLATFGLTGVILRFMLILYLAVKTKVYNNIYRMNLFIFAFAYQFTGSFIFNIVEYVMWALAFSPVFNQYDLKSLRKSSSES